METQQQPAVAEFTLIIPADILIFPKEFDCYKDDIVKVEGVVFLQLFLIQAIRPQDGLKSVISAIPKLSLHIFRGAVFVLFPADNGKNILRRKNLIVKSDLL